MRIVERQVTEKVKVYGSGDCFKVAQGAIPEPTICVLARVGAYMWALLDIKSLHRWASPKEFGATVLLTDEVIDQLVGHDCLWEYVPGTLEFVCKN